MTKPFMSLLALTVVLGLVLEVWPKGRKSLQNVALPDTNARPKLPRKGVSGRVSRFTLTFRTHVGGWDGVLDCPRLIGAHPCITLMLPLEPGWSLSAAGICRCSIPAF